MTAGERAVWAAEFVRALADGQSSTDAAISASSAVWMLQDIDKSREWTVNGAEDHRAMLDDMLGVPR